MSQTASVNLLSFHVSGDAEPGAPRPAWSLAGSFAVHVVACLAVMSLRVFPSIEQPLASYHVALVTLPERQAPRAAPPAQTLKQMVGALALPKQYEPSFGHASRQAIPLEAPRLAAVEPIFRNQEPPVERATEESPTAAALTRMIDSVQIPDHKKPPPAQTASASAPRVPEPLPRNTARKVRALRSQANIPAPAPPPLTRVPVGTVPTPSPAPAPAVSSKPERDGRQRITASLRVPDVPASGSRHAVAGETESGAPSILASLDGVGSETGHKYWGQLTSRIHRQWVIPITQDSRPRQAVLAFRLERTGLVKQLRVAQSSGYPEYDAIAQRAVSAASPFPPFPPTITESSLDINFTFSFKPD